MSRLMSTFQSTSPVRGTTYDVCKHKSTQQISIHVPREGDDVLMIISGISLAYFNPRPP